MAVRWWKVVAFLKPQLGLSIPEYVKFIFLLTDSTQFPNSQRFYHSCWSGVENERWDTKKISPGPLHNFDERHAYTHFNFILSLLISFFYEISFLKFSLPQEACLPTFSTGSWDLTQRRYLWSMAERWRKVAFLKYHFGLNIVPLEGFGAVFYFPAF